MWSIQVSDKKYLFIILLRKFSLLPKKSYKIITSEKQLLLFASYLNHF